MTNAKELQKVLRSAVEALEKYGDHSHKCRTYPVNRGGSAYDADSEESCSCGLRKEIERLKSYL